MDALGDDDLNVIGEIVAEQEVSEQSSAVVASSAAIRKFPLLRGLGLRPDARSSGSIALDLTSTIGSLRIGGSPLDDGVTAVDHEELDDDLLLEAMHHIRIDSAVVYAANQVHERLEQETKWCDVTLSAVRRACSKATKQLRNWSVNAVQATAQTPGEEVPLRDEPAGELKASHILEKESLPVDVRFHHCCLSMSVRAAVHAKLVSAEFGGGHCSHCKRMRPIDVLRECSKCEGVQ